MKYLYKYSYKGPDRLNIRVEDNQGVHDEIQEYLDCRYISPPEACWRIFGFGMHGQSHSVERLPIHLENSQTIIFDEDADNTDLLNTLERAAKTKLTAFFDLTTRDQRAKQLLYHEIPEHYCWDQSSKSWKTRTNKKNVLARMYSANPSEGERYYLRVLLCHMKGPTSFENLKLFNGVTYPTYKEAAIARGLLENDLEWRNCLNEASLSASPKQLRFLFSTVLIFCNPQNCRQLWDEFYTSMSEDAVATDEAVKLQKTIRKINIILNSFGKTINQFISGLPEINQTNLSGEQEEFIDNVGKLNERQKDVFDSVISAATTSSISNKVFFLDGPGGTGKTFLYNTLITYLKANNYKCIPVASSGISAELLSSGTTAHSKFKIPIPVMRNSMCHIPAQSLLASEIKQANLIIWDEAPMMNKLAVEAVDRTLRDLMEIPDIPFGGKAVLFGGDFRQILPVLERGSKSKVINSCLKNSYLWTTMVKKKLTENMRLEDSTQNFAKYLLNIGEGKRSIDSLNNRFRLPNNDLPGLINFIHEDLNNINFNNIILTTTNKVKNVSKF